MHLSHCVIFHYSLDTDVLKPVLSSTLPGEELSHRLLKLIPNLSLSEVKITVTVDLERLVYKFYLNQPTSSTQA